MFRNASLILAICAASATAQTPMFNGKDLSGWDGDPKLWKVENGTIVGQTTKDLKLKANSFLVWKGDAPADYMMDYEARVEGNNSGVQYRSKLRGGDKWKLAGYQMDLHPKAEYLGMLYEEGGRGIVCQRGQRVKISAGKKIDVMDKLDVPKVDLSKWNKYRIVVRGNMLRHFVNGQLAAEIFDEDKKSQALDGLIGLQLHAGAPMKVEFKNLQIKSLDAEEKGGNEGVNLIDGFKLEKIYDIPKQDQGSWVSMTVDDKGRLITCDQYGGLFQVTLGDPIKVEKLDLKIGGSHGMLWYEGALYMSVNERVGGDEGVYKITDSNNDGKLDKIDMILDLQGRGEHGPHSLVPSPDGKWIYFIAGNHVNDPKIDPGAVPPVWAEDHLLPRRADANGHARGRMAPGGWIARFHPDGTNWEMISIGYRNPYDLAFDYKGDLYAYDADMEWDFGMPWYRPTRICKVVPGSDFGWRHGTGKWPEYYEDGTPGVVDIGPGSPTGFLAGKGAKFPEKYQKALYAFDWTFATIYALHQVDGKMVKEEFLSASGMPLSDAEIGKDGAMYFLTGGRKTGSALWKVTYTGSEDTKPVEYANQIAPVVGLDKVAETLASDDHLVRNEARLVLERAFGEKPDPDISKYGTSDWAKINIAIIWARHKQTEKAYQALTSIEWDKLNDAQKVGWLRAIALVFIRTENPSDEWKKKVTAMIDASYPATDDTLNRELCRVLCYLDAPGVVGRTLSLMDSAGPDPAPAWAELAKRNARYGKAINNMLAKQPPTQVIHYIYCLRTVKGPWKLEDRKNFFAWITRLESKSGGNSYKGFLKGLRQDAVDNATEEERKQIKNLPKPTVVDPLANLPTPEGPGRIWTVEEVVKTVSKDGPTDKERGAKMYKAGMCAVCHQFQGEGGAIGPDLTTLSGRFSAEELAVAILEPSKEVSDQYHFEQFILEDGSQVIGREVAEKDEKIVVKTNPFNPSQTTEVVRANMVERKVSPVSPMPGGLINSMSEGEVRDLFAYLLGK